jgi:predicted nucleic acid-binding protein
MTSTLVDSNVVLDVVDSDEDWHTWSALNLERAADQGRLAINPIIFAEISMSFTDSSDLLARMSLMELEREALPWDAAFMAGKAHALYRKRSGLRDRALPDFFIGAHAVVKGHRLLTRDPRRYREYFPSLEIIAPDTHP